MSFYGVVMMGGVSAAQWGVWGGWGSHNELDIAVQSESFRGFSGENKQRRLMN